MRVLVGCPTYEGMSYCLKQYIEAIKNLSFDGYDVLLVDNSNNDTYYKKLLSKGVKVLRIMPLEDHRETIVKARNVIKEFVINGNYDYFLSLEQDVIPPKDVIEKLLRHNKKIVSGVYYKYKEINNNKVFYPILMVAVDENGKRIETNDPDCLIRDMYREEIEEDKLMKVEGCGLGCVLIHKEVLEKLSFRVEEGKEAYDDMFFSIDTKKNGFEIFADTSVKCKHFLIESKN